MALPPFLEKIVDWLRAGYPEGVPPTDYIPLFALLGSQLTSDELTLIAHELASSDDPESSEAIKKAIAAVTDTPVHDLGHQPGPRAPRGRRLAAGYPPQGLATTAVRGHRG